MASNYSSGPSNRISQIPVVMGVELHIAAKRVWGNLFFLPVWFAFWTFGGLMAMRWVINPGTSTPRLFISLWFVGWAFGETWATYQWFWTAFGKEIVKVNQGTLTIKRDILGYGTTRSFVVDTVRNLRASGFFPSNSYWENYLAQMKLGGGSIGFDSQGKTHRFGIQLTESDAQNAVEKLKAYLA
jgi:hypothetical protein